MTLTGQLRRTSQALLVVVAPHGGQAHARRNASTCLTREPGRTVPLALAPAVRPVAVPVPRRATSA